MTFLSRKKRRTTRRSISLPRAAEARWCALATALASLISLAGVGPALAAEGQWRSAGRTAEADPRQSAEADPRPATPEVALGGTDATRSVVVRRNGARVARTPSSNREFDPFDEAVELMPAIEPAGEPSLESAPVIQRDPFDDVAAAPAPADQYDPFDDAEVAAPAIEEPAAPAEEPIVEEQAPAMVEEPAAAPPAEAPAAPTIEEAFDEPAAPDVNAQRPGSATLGDEMIQGELKGEVVAPEPKAEVTISEPAETVEASPLEEELAAPELTDELDLPTGPLGDTQLDPDSGELLQPTPEQLEERRRQLDLQREKSEARCQELVEAVRADSIRSIDLDISVTGNPGEDFPFECRAQNLPFQGRNWSQVTYMWKASALCHKPLYFEQTQVERYGHSWGPALQPIMSGAHFFATIPILPYKMGIETPNECIYTLGQYRPGSCAPYMIPAFPFTWRAAAFQAGFATGAAVVVP